MNRKGSGSKREAIIEGALSVFLEDGYSGASMDRIAEEARVSKQTIYSHFSDKETLFFAIAEHLARSLNHPAENEPHVSLAPREFLLEVCRLYFLRMDSWEYRSFFRVVVAESSRFPALASLYVTSIVEPGLSVLVGYFNSHPELEIHDPEAQARIFRGALASFVLVQDILSGKLTSPMERERFTSALVETIVKGH